ncbi:MAG: hypothetical protein RLZZ451_666 [Pseudomonadota bacterium]
MLTWSASDAATCVASGGWSGSKLLWSLEPLQNLTATRVYTLTCTGPGGSTSASVTIGVDEPAPVLTLTVDMPTVIRGQSPTLTWLASHVTGCVASGGWSGARGAAGTESIAKPASTQSYELACTGLGGAIRRSVAVDVFPPPEAPAGVRAAGGDGSVSVEWSSQSGSFYAGELVTTTLYISTRPGIRPSSFVESGTDQVRRGLSLPAATLSGFANGVPLYMVATDVAGGIEGPPSEEVTITPQPILALVERMDALNDTGVVGCTDLTIASTRCPQPALPNQDGDVGRDAEAAAGRLAKTGFGRAGFDHTKLDATGAPLPADAAVWSCVRDNVTGLTWQVPTESGLTGSSNSYSWYQPDPARHMGQAGRPAGGACAGSRCDTDGYIRALNQAAWCGYQDWRLPTRREIYSLVNLDPGSLAFDPALFPWQPAPTNAYFWTSSVSSFAGLGSSVWVLYRNSKSLELAPKISFRPELSLGFVMAVR